MPQKKLRENSLFILVSLIWGLVVSIIKSIALLGQSMLGKNTRPLQENPFLDLMNFFFHIGPKSFWKSPSSIKIGRSIGTFLHYTFNKKAFTEKRR